MKVCVLASGSSHNCTFIGNRETRILIDAGLSRRDLFARMQAIGEDPRQLDAILITHEHTDHVCGLPPIIRKLKIPVFLSTLTAPAIDWGDVEPCVRTFQAGTSFQIGSLRVESFTIPHDAEDPVGFSVSGAGVKVSLVTDLGYIPESVKWHLRGSDAVIMESNHDLEMLKVGPYPWPVKQRVMGRRGHLSNELVSQFICDGLDSATSVLMLGHISENNNHPSLVKLAAARALFRRCLDTRVIVAETNQPSEAVQF